MYNYYYHQLVDFITSKSRLKTVLIFLLLVSNSFVSIYAQTSLRGLPIINTFSTEEYHGGIQNWDITQGANDLLYVANNFGLLVYDGESWDAKPIEASTRLLSVACNSEGLIYTGGQGDLGYFKVTKERSVAYLSLKDKLPDEYQNFNEIWKIYIIDDAVYFFTFQQIFRLKGGNLEVIDPKVTLGFSFKVRNQIYTQVPSKGLMKLSNNRLTPIKNGEKMIEKDIRGIIPFDMNSTLLATRNQGLFLMDNSSIVPWEIASNEWLKNAQINSIQVLSSNL